jgi:hypothetical protein
MITVAFIVCVAAIMWAAITPSDPDEIQPRKEKRA